jgi:hypothetical protein
MISIFNCNKSQILVVKCQLSVLHSPEKRSQDLIPLQPLINGKKLIYDILLTCLHSGPQIPLNLAEHLLYGSSLRTGGQFEYHGIDVSLLEHLRALLVHVLLQHVEAEHHITHGNAGVGLQLLK